MKKSYTKEESMYASRRIEERLQQHSIRLYFDDLNSRGRNIDRTKRRLDHIRKTFLSAFEESSTYDRFLILKAYCLGTTFLAEEQDIIIKEMLAENLIDTGGEDAIRIGARHFRGDVESKIEKKCLPRILLELRPFFKLMSNEEIREISKLLDSYEEAVSIKRRGINPYLVRIKAKLLRTAFDKTAMENGIMQR